MSVARFWRLGATFALLCFTSPLLAQQGFLIPSHALDQLDSLTAAEYQRPHGAGVWLSGGHELRMQLNAAGVPFEHFPEAGQIRIYDYRLDPREARPDQLSAPRDADGLGLGLVQFHAPLRSDDVRTLQSAGLEPLQYYPHQAYLVWGSAQALASLAGRSEVRFAGDFPADVRIAPELHRKQGLIQNVNVHFVNTGRTEETLARLSALGANVLDAWRAQPDGRLWDAKIEIDASLVPLLAGIPEVVASEFLSPEVFTDDEMSSQIVAGNFSGAGVPFTGYADWLETAGVDGSGVIWSVIDTGVAYSHPDVGPRIVGGNNYPGVSPALPGNDVAGGGHGTHVAGIIAGDASGGFADANGFLYGLGIAPGASIWTQNALMGSSWPPVGGWQLLTKHATEGNAIGVNNSWHTGEGAGMGYRAPERTHDLMVLDGNFDSSFHEPINIVFSAGNSGPGATTLTAPKEAKNVVVTGSTANYRTGNIDSISGFSSRGPAVDGRIGVTVAAPGAQIASARNPLGGSCSTAIAGTDNLYAFCSGTSMAAPQVSGFMVLLAEWWRGMNDGADFSPAMGKALVVNSARNISGTGPNGNSGFGRINASTIFDSELSFEFWDQEDLFTETGEFWTVTVGVVDPSQPLKITLAWSDAPGAVGANPALVNDLDLSVETGGETYFGNVTSGVWSASGGSPDRLNNIEQVWVQNPGGSATIRIDAFQLAGSAILHGVAPGSLAQHFALVCQNCIEEPSFTLAAEPRQIDVCVPDEREVAVSIGSILGFDDPVMLDVADLPDGVSFEFSVNPVTPAGDSELTLTFDAEAEPGLHTSRLDAAAGEIERSLNLTLGVFNQPSTQPSLLAPGNNSSNQPLSLTLSWEASEQGFEYRVLVARDSAFTDIVVDQVTNSTSLEISGLDSSTTYYWRVIAINSCGETQSVVRHFSTQSLPGDCPVGTEPEAIYGQDFDGGSMPAGWSTTGSVGAQTWSASTAQVHTGSHAMFAPNLPTVSDQRLISPAVSLPAASETVLLSFWNWQHLESRAAGGCWDGGLLEISTDGGTNWTQVNTPALLTRAYDGLIQSGYQNPLAGSQGWCGDPRDWERYAVDLSGWAGQTVQFRFRLGTDSTVSRPGWYIDDFRVTSCVAVERPDPMFEDRFEAAQ